MTPVQAERAENIRVILRVRHAAAGLPEPGPVEVIAPVRKPSRVLMMVWLVACWAVFFTLVLLWPLPVLAVVCGLFILGLCCLPFRPAK